MFKPICNLQIWRTGQIAACADVSYYQCVMRLTGQPAGLPVIAASTLMDDTQDEVNLTWAKRLTFDVADRGKARRLTDLLSRQHLVAVYTDERGVRRVCGSADHPLHLSTAIRGGRISCELRGTGVHADPVLSLNI